VIHDPIDGNPNRLLPVFIMSTDGPWFGMSVTTDRTWQNSSIILPIFGKMSLTSCPFCPHFVNSNGDRIRLPVANSVRGVLYGSGCPSYRSSMGL
jgi:hypothetical protein